MEPVKIERETGPRGMFIVRSWERGEEGEEEEEEEGL